MTNSPYADLPERAYWRTGVALQDQAVPSDLYRRKWPITADMRIGTAGSCFAQHIGRTLRSAGFNVLDTEPAPDGLPDDQHANFGYRMYSARYGNVYTVRQMLQLAQEAFGEIPMRRETWATDSGHVDALRPTIEPVGLASAAVVHAHRGRHLERVAQVLTQMDVFVFTLGLTEAWVNRDTGTVYPVCPGTVAGTFDPALHRFHNFTYLEILADFVALRALLDKHRAGRPLRILLTVSPVPLTATATAHHVQVATVYSKSVLRAAAGAIADNDPAIDYFPSFEIITSPWSGSDFFGPNKRSVTAAGVAQAMSTFITAHDVTAAAAKGPAVPADNPRKVTVTEEDAAMLVKCDEELLEAFGKRAS